MKQILIIQLFLLVGCEYARPPVYFLKHTGEVRIVDKIDHPSSGFFRQAQGYVEMNPWDNYPCYVQKFALFSTLEQRTIHEQVHSFEFNIRAKLDGEYERFHADFDPLLGREYDVEDLPPIVLKLLENPQYIYVSKFITGGYAGTLERGKKMPKCKGCGYSGDPDTFEPTMSAYHDLRCPKCGTTAIDTSDINKEWAEQGEEYGYGDDNFLKATSSR